MKLRAFKGLMTKAGIDTSRWDIQVYSATSFSLRHLQSDSLPFTLFPGLIDVYKGPLDSRWVAVYTYYEKQEFILVDASIVKVLQATSKFIDEKKVESCKAYNQSGWNLY